MVNRPWQVRLGTTHVEVSDALLRLLAFLVLHHRCVGQVQDRSWIRPLRMLYGRVTTWGSGYLRAAIFESWIEPLNMSTVTQKCFGF
jgi:hypothetical protein